MPTVTEYLRCELTEAELAAMAHKMARETEAITAAQETLKEVKANISAQIAGYDKHVQELSRMINQGYEQRSVICEVLMDTPEPGQKTIVRTDNGKEVRVDPMTDFDLQRELPLEDSPTESETI